MGDRYETREFRLDYECGLRNHFYRTLQNAEMGWLFEIMYDMPQNPRIVEIGTSRGFSTFMMTTALKAFGKGGTIYCIDPWTGTDTDLERKFWVNEIKDPDSHYNDFVINAKQFGFWDMVNPYRITSREAAPMFPDNYFDMIWIDGDHGYEMCKEDLYLWDKKVKPNGIYAGHDWVFDTVQQAVKEYCIDKRYHLIPTFGNAWQIIRVDVQKACWENGKEITDPNLSFSFNGKNLVIVYHEPEKEVVDGGEEEITDNGTN